jgi:hypothetical protein
MAVDLVIGSLSDQGFQPGKHKKYEESSAGYFSWSSLYFFNILSEQNPAMMAP